MALLAAQRAVSITVHCPPTECAIDLWKAALPFTAHCNICTANESRVAQEVFWRRAPAPAQAAHEPKWRRKRCPCTPMGLMRAA